VSLPGSRQKLLKKKGKSILLFLESENLVALGGESCSSSREVTVAFNFISNAL
jgi:hypothetical protein